MVYSFATQLGISKGARLASDKETIYSMLDGCVSVVEASTELDLKGVDYIATLRGGAQVYVDAKMRAVGCSRFWRGNPVEPEVAIEKWSVMPGGKFNTSRAASKAGWTLDENKVTDMILYVFDKSDCGTAYFIPFQSLRMAARRNIESWMYRYKVDIQESARHRMQWQSQAVFVPISTVISAVNDTFVQ